MASALLAKPSFARVAGISPKIGASRARAIVPVRAAAAKEQVCAC